MTTQDSFFQRFRSDDPLALARKIEQDERELARAAHDERMQLEILSRLGPRLTILGKEQAAAPLLEQALALPHLFLSIWLALCWRRMRRTSASPAGRPSTKRQRVSMTSRTGVSLIRSLVV
jgi:hypothetical protein